MKFDGSLGFKNDAARIRFSNLRDKVRRNEDSIVKMMISIGGFENSQHFYPVLSNVEMKKWVEIFLEQLTVYGRSYKFARRPWCIQKKGDFFAQEM